MSVLSARLGSSQRQPTPSADPSLAVTVHGTERRRRLALCGRCPSPAIRVPLWQGLLIGCLDMVRDVTSHIGGRTVLNYNVISIYEGGSQLESVKSAALCSDIESEIVKRRPCDVGAGSA